MSSSPIRFGIFEVDRASGELRKAGIKVKLQEQPFQLLCALLEHPGEVVTREELRQRLWPEDTYVDFDRSLNTAASRLREALGDSAANPRFVETLPRRGYRFIAPLTGSSGNVASGKNASHAESSNRTWFIGVGTVVALAVIGSWFLRDRAPETGDIPLRPVALTTYDGREFCPALSPDGTQVAFSGDVDEKGNFDIYVKDVDGHDHWRLTRDPAIDMKPVWSPDGKWIAFMRRPASPVTPYIQDPATTYEIRKVPYRGGVETKITEVTGISVGEFSFRFGGLDWSPDGKYLLLVGRTESQSEYLVYRVSPDTGEKERFDFGRPEIYGASSPRYSPDGRSIAFAAWSKQQSILGIFLWTLPETGRPNGGPVLLTDWDGKMIWELAWAPDGKDLVLASGRPGAEELWRIPVAGGQRQLLELGGDSAHSPAVSSAGRKLAYVREMRVTDLYRAPGPAAAPLTDLGGDSAHVPVVTTSSSDGQPAISPDGKQIAFNSRRTGNPEIWICDSDGSNQRPLTKIGAGSPRWSPDGKWIAFDSGAAGNKDIWKISPTGGAPQRLTKTDSHDCKPTWSADGNWIYFTLGRGGGHENWKVSADGETAKRVVDEGVHFQSVFESPDGETLYVCRMSGQVELEAGLWKIPPAGDDWTKVAQDCFYYGTTVLDDGIYMARERNRKPSVLEFFDLAEGRLERIQTLPEGVHGASVSPDGKWIVYAKTKFAMTDIMLVENFK